MERVKNEMYEDDSTHFPFRSKFIILCANRQRNGTYIAGVLSFRQAENRNF